MKKENNLSSEIEDINTPQTCFLSNFPPKECGIATFTKDLSKAMDRIFNPKLKSKVIAINEEQALYNYSKKVIMTLDKNDIETYIDIAKKINESENIKIISVQHEFGIFGGIYGDYLIPFLESIKKPVVVTFHSVLPNPDEKRKKIVRAIASRSSAIIVMANVGVDILNKEYGIEREKVHIIPHGIPNVPYKDNEEFKKKLNLNDKIVVLTFGLLSRGKGIEYMIKALPPLVKKYPNLLYLVIGETHPVIRKREGEKYRNELIDLVKKLNLKKNVKFYNKYLTLQEITDYIQACDVYVCTNLDKNQITSGTLAYALGCGRAVVSTPSIYAKELLDEKRGIIVELMNPKSYTKAIAKILSDEEFKKSLEKKSYSYTRPMTWANVAIRYLQIFNKIVKLREELIEKFPKIKLNHLINLTDNTGIIQFSNHSTPDKKSGYTLDDNARALIFSVSHHKLFKSQNVSQISLNLAKTYLKFIELSQEPNGNFKNNHENQEEITNPYSEDSFGRAIWALGFTTNKSENQEVKEKANNLLVKSLSYLDNINSPRAKAFSIIGLYYYYKTTKDPSILEKIKKLSDDLIGLYELESSEDWQWFEPYLTYSNSKLSESIFYAYDVLKDEKYLKVAEKTLEFLSDLMFVEGNLCPIGQNGWCKRNGKRAFFDQQPLDVSSITISLLTAYKITNKKDYYDKAIVAFNWFLGKNHLKQMMYDESTGGCYDGLGKHSVNLNQGAESTISYLLARIFLEDCKRQAKKKQPINTEQNIKNL